MEKRDTIFLHTVAYVLGFTTIFSLIGILLQTALSSVALEAGEVLRIVGGIVILTFGTLMLASLKYSIPFFNRPRTLKVKKFDNRYLNSFIFGAAFAVGWTPCVGFILGAIYALAATSPGIAFALLFTYSLGLGIPFLIAGAFFSKFSSFIEKSENMLKYFNIVGGLLLIIIGLLVIGNFAGLITLLFLGTDTSLMISGQLSFVAAFVAGLVSFFTPCILPLVPGFLSYMAGTVGDKK